MADNMTMKIAIGAALSGTFGAAFKAAKSQVSGLVNYTKSLETKQKSLQNSIDAVKKAYESGKISVEQYDKAMKKLGDTVSSVQKKQALAAKMQASQDKFKTAGDKANSMMGTAMQAAGAAYVMAQPIRDAIKFEGVMADVKKVVDFDTPEQFKQMNADILNLSRSLPMTAEDIAKIVAAGGQAGVAKDELLTFASDAAKMGIAFDITADEAGDMMAKWRTAFKMGQSDVVQLADKINYLGNTTAASAPKISDVVSRIGPLGDVGGVAAGEIAALGASMVGQAVPSEIAATGIKNLILGLTAGEGATKTQAEAFQKLGLNAADMAKMMQTDAKGAILQVMQAIKGLNKEEQATVLTDLFGKESVAAIAPLLTNLEGLQDNFNKVADETQYAGSMQKEYEARCQTTENAMTLLKNQLMSTSITIGSVLLPTFNNVLKVVADAAAGFAKFAEENPNLSASLVGIALSGAGAVAGISLFGAVGQRIVQGVEMMKMTFNGLKLAFTVIGPYAAQAGSLMLRGISLAGSGVMKAAGLIMRGFSLLGSTVIKAAGYAVQGFKLIGMGIRALTMTMMANPILLAIMAIATAALLIYAYWDDIKPYFEAFWETIKPYWEAFVTWITNVWDGVVAAISAFCDWVSAIFTTVTNWAIGVWQAVSNFLTTMWDAAVSAVSNFVASIQAAIDGVVQWIMDKWGKLKEILSHPIDAVVNFVKGGDATAEQAGANVMQNAAGGIYGKGAFLTTFAEQGPEAAIPINNTPRAQSLFYKTGQLMGLLPNESDLANNTRSIAGANGGSTSIVATFAPQITVQGSADMSTMRNVLADGARNFKREIDELMNQRRRVAFE